jgi:predicted negative regulator of RcsB-dependent stress response
MLELRRLRVEIGKVRDERMKLIGALDGRIDSKEKRQVAEQRIAELLTQEGKLRDSANYLQGVMDTLDYYDRCWGQNA